MADGDAAPSRASTSPTGPPSTWPSAPPAEPVLVEPVPAGSALGGAHYPPGPPAQWPAWSPAAAWGAPTDGPPDPPRPERQGGRLAAVVVAVVAAVVLVVVAIGVLSGAGGDDDVALDRSDLTTLPPPTIDPGTGPSLPSLPSLPIDPTLPGADPEALARPLAEVLPEIIEFVERTRGHEFVTEPEVEAVDDAEFERRLAEATEAEEASLLVDQTALRALGTIDPDTDLVDASRTAGSGGVLGFYLPSTGELLVKGDVVTPLVQTVIAHELTHALDDQVFDLSRLDLLAERPDESAFGLVAVVEGTARWVENQYRDQLSPEELAAVATEQVELGLRQTQTMIDLPLPFLVQSQVPYSVGHRLVVDLVDRGGVDLLDVAVQRPPTTSEQVLDADLFLAREPAVGVPAPQTEAGGVEVDRGAFGAVDLRMMEVVDPASAVGALTGELDPVVGFGGGEFVSWTSAQGDDCITIHVRGDTAAGASTVREVLDEWAGVVGADVTADGAGPGIDLATSCV